MRVETLEILGGGVGHISFLPFLLAVLTDPGGECGICLSWYLRVELEER